MLESDRAILDQFARGIMPELQAVSGSFGETFDYHIDDDALVIDASPYINVLIDGRAPTGAGASRGTPTLQQSILAWINRHNITPYARKDGKIPTAVQLSWAMSKSIHAHGTLLYQRGGGRDIFAPIINDQRINALLSQFDEDYRNRVTTQLNQTLKNT